MMINRRSFVFNGYSIIIESHEDDTHEIKYISYIDTDVGVVDKMSFSTSEDALEYQLELIGIKA